MSAPLPVQPFVRPLPLLALAVMAFNDHVLKAAWPGFVTGKISDVAVVLYGPALLTACWGLALLAVAPLARHAGTRLDPRPTRRRLAVSAAVVAAILAAINLSPRLRDVYVALLSAADVPGLAPGGYRYLVDPTDLLALLALPLALWDGRRAIDGGGVRQETAP